ncbi:MAG: Uma2 family endonuclease [Deltaproteobacteria bacterium]|nr:Uma2 family endonuclease [Deltaproteobacteria bacterium]
MSTTDAFVRDLPVRPLKRVEYELLAAEGYFHDEAVELLFGVVVPMSPTDPAHGTSTHRLAERLRDTVGKRAQVRVENPLAASEISEPQPDIIVIPDLDYWREHPSKAFLVVEVSRSSLRKDKGPKAALYGLAAVEEYWIVNHVEEVVEVYRDRHEGEWRQRTTHQRGDIIKMVAFPDVEIAVSEILPPV